MREQHRWQGAGDQQDVIKPVVKEGDFAVRLDQPAIERIKAATEQEEWIKDVSKPFHSSAKMIMPKPKPNNTFKMRTFPKSMERAYAPVVRLSRICRRAIYQKKNCHGTFPFPR
jgi:hypothetical protein